MGYSVTNSLTCGLVYGPTFDFNQRANNQTGDLKTPDYFYRNSTRTVYTDLPLSIYDCNSNPKGTAYDLLLEGYSNPILYGGIKMKNFTTSNHNVQYQKVEKYYKLFSFIFLGLSLLMFILTFGDIPWLPKEVTILGTLMFISGAIGMYTDMVRWKEK